MATALASTPERAVGVGERPSAGPRIAALDGVRGTAVMMVVVWHYFYLALPEPATTLGGVGRSAALAWSGVDLFFVLSGFLIGGILLDHADSARYFQTFYIRRACRILPPYAILLGAYVFARALAARGLLAGSGRLLAGSVPTWAYLAFVQNAFMAVIDGFGPAWLGITWSLAVEEQFYLALPVLVRGIRRALIAKIALAAIVLAPLMRATIGLLGSSTGAFVLLPCRADALMAGVLLACIVGDPLSMDVLRAHLNYVRAAALVLLAGAVVLTMRPSLIGTFRYSWLAALYATVIALCVVSEKGVVARVFATPVLGRLGALSYAIYLFHEPVNGVLHGAIAGQSPHLVDGLGVAVTMVAVAVTVATATLSYLVVERPLIALGHTARY